MAIPGIGTQSLASFSPNQTGARSDVRDKSLARESQPSTALTTANIEASTKSTTLFNPVASTNNADKSTTSRRDLSELETFRTRFQFQKANSPDSDSARAVQSFVDVANFESKDEFNTLYGIDITV